jgi:hypothetical protein
MRPQQAGRSPANLETAQLQSLPCIFVEQLLGLPVTREGAAEALHSDSRQLLQEP